MIITCNRIIFPPSLEDDDEVIREAKRFYYETIVIEMTFEKFDQMYREWYEEAQIQEDEDHDDGFRFWIPLN